MSYTAPPERNPPGVSEPSHEAKALNRLAAAVERLADVYLYVNDPEQEAQGPGSLSEVPRL